MRRRRKAEPPRAAALPRDRAEVLAWLDRRINFERTPPGGAAAPFGLARVRRLMAAVGGPHERLPVAHVAGTKGKGSTVAMLAAVLQEAGHRVGCYLSPHVHTLEERICVDGRPISAADLVAACAVVIPAVERLDAAAARRGARGPSWFEVVTAVALVHFVRAGVEIAVLETGLGGRLDATNVSRPLVTVITSISLDHMAVLGPTIGRIAREKAGIIKRGCPVVSAVQRPAARRVIAATAARRRSRLLELGRDFSVAHSAIDPFRGDRVAITLPDGVTVRCRLGMAGRHQAENAALAAMAARELDSRGFHVPTKAIVRGLGRTRLPARIERIGTRPLTVVDAAHNVASMRSLVETLAPVLERLRPRVLVFAASADKQIEEMLAAAAGRFDHVVVTRYLTNPRAATVERLADACRRAGLPAAQVAAGPREALRMARSLATRRGVVCVAGSFFLAAEIGGRSRS
jgi:dihydrofolate synthase/folylpolyglutamate synthase